MQRMRLLPLAGWVALAGCLEAQHDDVSPQEVAPVGEDLVMMFPGVINTRHHMVGLRDLIRARHPGWRIDLRNWGTPLLSLSNLSAYERNLETAAARAAELAAYRREHPDGRITVLGYSGGGGMALFTLAALPKDVQVDRVILIAPAISPAYPVQAEVLPHVAEFLVNYASNRDLQVGWGTHIAGSMDRVKAHSCGFTGFNLDDPKIVDVFWTPAMARLGHFGNHLGYVSAAWQRTYLAPALDPRVDAKALRTMFADEQHAGE
jgi:pimeloyl-ACP methyl ester carboxylesterase